MATGLRLIAHQSADMHHIGHGAFWCAVPTMAELADQEEAIATGRCTGMVEIVQDEIWVIYARGRCVVRYSSDLYAACDLAPFVERRGVCRWLAERLMGLHHWITACLLDRAMCRVRGRRS